MTCQGARNIYLNEDLEAFFYPAGLQSPPLVSPSETCAIVFHCEFSSKRGPRLCRHLRHLDRTANIDNYPRLHFPEVGWLVGRYIFSHPLSLSIPQYSCLPPSILPQVVSLRTSSVFPEPFLGPPSAHSQTLVQFSPSLLHSLIYCEWPSAGRGGGLPAQLYLLQLGYKEFFTRHPEHTEPQAYVPMEQNREECRRYMPHLLRRKSQSKSVSDLRLLV